MSFDWKKSAKVPWHHNIKFPFWSFIYVIFVSLSFYIIVFLSFISLLPLCHLCHCCFFVLLSCCLFFVFLSFCIFVLLSFCLFITLIKRLKGLNCQKSPFLCQYSTVALIGSLTRSDIKKQTETLIRTKMQFFSWGKQLGWGSRWKCNVKGWMGWRFNSGSKFYWYLKKKKNDTWTMDIEFWLKHIRQILGSQ